MKALGFNTLRMHVKVEEARFYYLCDKLGMAVWQDMPNGGGEYDIAGYTTGVVEKARLIDGTKVKVGDVLLGISSSGVHSMGASDGSEVKTASVSPLCAGAGSGDGLASSAAASCDAKIVGAADGAVSTSV